MQIKFQNDNDCSSHENKSHSQEIWQNFSNRLDETIKKIVATSSFSVPYLAMETRRLILRRVALKKKKSRRCVIASFFSKYYFIFASPTTVSAKNVYRNGYTVTMTAKKTHMVNYLLTFNHRLYVGAL